MTDKIERIIAEIETWFKKEFSINENHPLHKSFRELKNSITAVTEPSVTPSVIPAAIIEPATETVAVQVEDTQK